MRLLAVTIVAIFTIIFGTGNTYAPCVSCKDTIPNILDSLISKRIDSAAVVTNKQLDSINVVKDSVIVQLKSIIRERKKKIVLGNDIGWKIDSFKTSDGKVQYWNWLFFKYPDGEYKFYKLVKYEYKNRHHK